MDQRLPQRLCFVLGGVFVTSLVVSDIIGGAKLVELGMAFGRHIWLRATGSTVFSQLMDTVVVQFINFGGLLAVGEIWALALNSYVLKFLLAVVMTPVIYLGHAILGRTFQLDAAPTS